MAEAIRMPLLSDTMKEGIIAEWHKKVGDKVQSDDVIAEVETDKATMEVLPYVEGTLLYIGVEKGKAAKVNEVIAVIGEEGEDYKSALGDDGGEPTGKEESADADSKEEKEDKPEAKEDKKEQPKKKKEKPKGDATVVRMPLLSDTMKEGKIVAWHKKVGDEVKSDDVLADVETDKATMEVMGYADGVLLHIGVEEGSAAKVNDIIAIVGEKGTDIEPYLDDAEDDEDDSTEEVSSESKQKPEAKESKPSENKTSTIQSSKDGDRVKASPLAKKLAEDKGIDIADVEGSGDGGRIIKRDKAFIIIIKFLSQKLTCQIISGVG